MIKTQKPRLPTSLSDGARAFISAALEKDPDQRPTIMQLLQHPWITGGSPGSMPSKPVVQVPKP